MLSIEFTNLTVDNCTFINNTVTKVGVLNIRKGYIEVIGRLEIRGNTGEWGVLSIQGSEFRIHHNITIKGNDALLSTIDIRNSKLELNGSIEFIHNIGGIFIEESKIVLNRPSIFCDNSKYSIKILHSMNKEVLLLAFGVPFTLTVSQCFAETNHRRLEVQ